MSFLELELNPSYDSDSDDILEDFYIPVLSNCKRYQRLAGFFTSNALAVAAKGVLELIQNNGKMELIVGAKLQKDDVDAICEGKKNPDKILSENMLLDLELIEEKIEKDHVKALAWMIANGTLEIKVAIVYGSNGIPLDFETACQKGIFHQKIGILEDSEGNVISFSGSINETAAAWKDNIEEFKVFRSWVPGEVNHLKTDIRRFEKFWHGETERLKIYDVPLAVRQKLIEIAPKEITNLNLGNKKPTMKLRSYQKDAITAWFENFNNGIFEMATGTGKTYTAIGATKKLIEKEKKLVVVVTCPFIHLVSQWKENLEDFGFSCLEAFGSSTTWQNKLANKLFDFKNNIHKVICVVTTHDTFSSLKFTKLIKSISGNVLLIADEVHGLGSPERRKGLISTYNYRLGLSATPTRWFDDEGTDLLLNFFDKVVFIYSLEKAIENGYLSKYEYYPYLVELNSDEFEKYREITKRIVIEYQKTKNSKKRSQLLNLFCILRQKIIVNADAKFLIFKEILDKIENLCHCLVYCSPQQIAIVQNILNERGVIQHKFTAKENLKERERLLDSFAKGQYRILVAMKCLDEGVDVPATKTAIILASSTNPKEFIQRRGRILRKSPGKDKAIIYDVIVVPSLSTNINDDFFDLEASIMKKEILRYIEFAKTAINSGLAYAKISPIASKYHIALEEY